MFVEFFRRILFLTYNINQEKVDARHSQEIYKYWYLSGKSKKYERMPNHKYYIALLY